MKPVAFGYVRAESAEHAAEALREHGDEAKVLAGGQSLVPALNMRLARPSVLVDLNRASGLNDLGLENGSLSVGAMVRQSAAERSELVRAECPLLAEALPYVGHPVTRNRGTVGGSIAHADAAAELPVVLVALGGAIVTSRRTLDAAEFFVSHFTTVLEADELVVATTWPRAQPGEGSAFAEFTPRHGDFALASAACVLRVENGVVADARLAMAAVTDRPELVEVEALRGSAVDADVAEELSEAAARAVDPPPNLHGSPAYRRRLVATLVARVLVRAWERAAA